MFTGSWSWTECKDTETCLFSPGSAKWMRIDHTYPRNRSVSRCKFPSEGKKTIIEIFPYVSYSIFIASYLLFRAINQKSKRNKRWVKHNLKNIVLYLLFYAINDIELKMKIFFDLLILIRKSICFKLFCIKKNKNNLMFRINSICLKF